MSEANTYKVVFKGEISNENTLEGVKANLVRLFKSNETTIEKLFSGKNMTIKKDMPEKQALSYQQAMKKAGAVAYVIDMTPPPLETIEITELPVEEKMTGMTDEDLVAPPTFPPPEEEETFAPPPPAELTNAADPLGIAPVEQWNVDDIGVRMSKPKRPLNKPLPITDYLELSPPKSELEQIKHTVDAVNPDISHLDISELGAQLSDEKLKEKVDIPDLSNLNIAEIGEDMGQAVQVKELYNPDISEYSLAESGSQIEQLKHDKKIIKPDISHLNLSDQ